MTLNIPTEALSRECNECRRILPSSRFLASWVEGSIRLHCCIECNAKSSNTVAVDFGNKPNDNQKRCQKCGRMLSVDSFGNHYDGLQPYCKLCSHKIQHNRDAKYTWKTIDTARAIQGNRCFVCGADKPGGKSNEWHIDHDHATGEFRSLLCMSCNLNI